MPWWKQFVSLNTRNWTRITRKRWLPDSLRHSRWATPSAPMHSDLMEISFLRWKSNGSLKLRDNWKIRLTSVATGKSCFTTVAASAECDWFLFTMHQYPLMSIKSFTSMIHPHTPSAIIPSTLAPVYHRIDLLIKSHKTGSRSSPCSRKKNNSGDVKMFFLPSDVKAFYFFKIGIVYKSKGSLKDFTTVCCALQMGARSEHHQTGLGRQ